MAQITGFEEFAGDLDEFAGELEEIADEIDEAIDKGVRDTALSIEGTAKRLAPVDDGELRADLKAIRIEKGVFSVGSTKEYAPPTEYGSVMHPITPNGPYPLRFEKDGQEVRTHSVLHPGTPAQPFLRPALDEHRSDLVENIHDEIEKLIDSKL